MAEYKIELKKSAIKELTKIPKGNLKRIIQRITSLKSNPHPPGAEKLSGEEKYRIRCGNYRILYLIEEDLLIIYVIKVAHRKDVYR